MSRDKFGRAWRHVRGAFIAVAVFSAAVNVLTLTGPLYMLQIYDRVMASGSVPTLVALSILVAGLYAMLGVFSFLRARVMSRVGAWLDERLGDDLLRVWVARSGSGAGTRGALHKPLADLSLMRSYLASPAFMALFDLPWFPFYLAVLFLFHPYLGYLALGGVTVAIFLAFLNQRLTSRPQQLSAALERQAMSFAEQGHKNAEAILAMGMLDNCVKYWRRLHRQGLRSAQSGSERGQIVTNMSRAFRMLLQSALLGLGAWLAIKGEISSGSIIAGSIIGGRALAPIDQTIAGWQHTLRARAAYRRLKKILKGVVEDETAAPTSLPTPKGFLEARHVTKFAPDGSRDADGRRRVILADVHFSLGPGDGLGVIGPSASGKTTLARLLTGVWLPDSGSVRVDGAPFEQWDNLELGRHVGYLPQTHEIMAGTVAQNIARFDPHARDEDIVAAAQLAGVHEMILDLPDGYATQVGPSGANLSAGQRQRVALARAVFRMPRIVVLDEPNSNLDSEGDAALTAMIARLREAGAAVVVMTHRPSAIAAVDHILVLQGGRQVRYGPKSEVLRRAPEPAPV